MIKMIDLFAGCGGLTDGFLQTGLYKEIASVEWLKPQVNTMRNRLKTKYNEADAIVTDKKQKKDTMSPPKLFSLTKLQNYLGKKYKMSMEKSLALTQGLYEKGFLTYPRTNSEYLAVAEKDKVKKIINNIKELGYPVKFVDKKTIFDDSKIESHSALTPTYKIPKPDSLSDEDIPF